jgi:hypothetical protein
MSFLALLVPGLWQNQGNPPEIRAMARFPTRRTGARFAAALALGLLLAVARAAPPERDLLLEIREVQEGGTGYVVGTEPQVPLLPPRRVQVHNGQPARMNFMQTTPIEWTAAAVQGRTSQGTGGTSNYNGGAAVAQRLIWLQAGQNMVFLPRWNGGEKPVRVEVQVQTARIEPSTDGRLPTQQGSELQTVVDAPLGAWVTLARTGTPAAQGTYRSDARDQRPRLLQLRVTLP